jgi:hypothetical protein
VGAAPSTVRPSVSTCLGGVSVRDGRPDGRLTRHLSRMGLGALLGPWSLSVEQSRERLPWDAAVNRAISAGYVSSWHSMIFAAVHKIR